MAKMTDPQNEVVSKIAKAFNTSFETFKADKEAVKVLSARERGWYEGREEGKEEGRKEGVTIGAIKLAELIKSGLSVDEAVLKIKEEQNGLVDSLALQQ